MTSCELQQTLGVLLTIYGIQGIILEPCSEIDMAGDSCVSDAAAVCKLVQPLNGLQDFTCSSAVHYSNLCESSDVQSLPRIIEHASYFCSTHHTIRSSFMSGVYCAIVLLGAQSKLVLFLTDPRACVYNTFKLISRSGGNWLS